MNACAGVAGGVGRLSQACAGFKPVIRRVFFRLFYLRKEVESR